MTIIVGLKGGGTDSTWEIYCHTWKLEAGAVVAYRKDGWIEAVFAPGEWRWVVAYRKDGWIEAVFAPGEWRWVRRMDDGTAPS